MERSFSWSAPALGWALLGSVARPLSAQAQMPGRPSGADKEQEPAKNEDGAGQRLIGPPADRAAVAARHRDFRSRPRRAHVASRIRVNPELTSMWDQPSSSGSAPGQARRLSAP